MMHSLGIKMKYDKTQRSYAIILASGSGLRFNSKDQPKHLIDICGVPVIIWTLDTIIKSKQFEEIAIVTKKSEMISTENIISKYFNKEKINLMMTYGGDTRMESFLNGLEEISNNFSLNDLDIISLIDSNRPFCSYEQIINLKNKVLDHGCACPARPVVNGVAKVSSNKIIDVPSKEDFIEFVTPEFMQYGILKKSIELFKNNLPNSLVEFSLGIANEPYVIESSEINSKLTYPEDLNFLEGLSKKYNLNIPRKIDID